MLLLIDFNFINVVITILLGIVIPLALLVIRMWSNIENFKKFKLEAEIRFKKEEERREEEIAQRHSEHTAILLQLNDIQHNIKSLSEKQNNTK